MRLKCSHFLTTVCDSVTPGARTSRAYEPIFFDFYVRYFSPDLSLLLVPLSPSEASKLPVVHCVREVPVPVDLQL